MRQAMPPLKALARQLGVPQGKEALRGAAQIYLHFLSLTQRRGWEQAHRAAKVNGVTGSLTSAERDAVQYVESAASRYLAFMDQPDLGGTKQKTPAHDIAVAWGADLLRPGQHAVGLNINRQGGMSWYGHQQLCLLQSSSQFRPTSRTEAYAGSWVHSVMAGGATFFYLCSSFAAVGPLALPFCTMGGVAIGGLVKVMSGGERTISGAAVSPGIRKFDDDDDGIVTDADRRQALWPWVQSQKETEKQWRASPGRTLQPGQRRQADAVAAAMMAQSKFAARVLSMGPAVITPKFIDHAIDKYAAFLQLARDHPEECVVPTLDIDLIWHAHMLSPQDYEADVRGITGRLLTHNDQMDDGRLDSAFERTKTRWHAKYGVHYVVPEGGGGGSSRRSQAQQQQQQQGGGGGGCGVVPIYIPIPVGGASSETAESQSEPLAAAAAAAAAPSSADTVDDPSTWDASWQTSDTRWDADVLYATDPSIAPEQKPQGDDGYVYTPYFDSGDAGGCGSSCGGGCGGG